MAQTANDQDNETRDIVESFRDAARNDLLSSYGDEAREAIKTFVQLDTWLKLDAAARPQAVAAHDLQKPKKEPTFSPTLR